MIKFRVVFQSNKNGFSAPDKEFEAADLESDEGFLVFIDEEDNPVIAMPHSAILYIERVIE
jgi:hypothetical protein